MLLSVRSIVSITASALTSNAARPTAPSRLARVENCWMPLMIGRTIESGMRVDTK
jgi:hypothetical protein